ncbi:hypothetical protein [Halomonas chromatireducens]|uniref:Uncharacterized protein n=1 Tax=Halomonas chromatireducens TaxID=507626 RepID=A0A120JVJ3_9GAMM|nr:hypothetical protein [Halomonas chromatireducens]AMC99360.1 hypothetical protein LOKO_00264 [Halomonas chromatireducens]
MIGFLIFPILICGYLYISSWPPEKIKISLYHGWSLYIRAAAFGFIIVTAIFFIFGAALPKLGLLIYHNTGFSLTSSSSIFSLVSSFIEDSHVFRLSQTAASDASIDMASVSIVSILITWLTFGLINFISKSQRKTIKKIAEFFWIEHIKACSIERIFLEKSPIEHQLLIIANKAKEDLAYNDYIKSVREKAFKAVVDGDINRDNKDAMNEIFSALQYRSITYSLITLENDKFYIGLPVIIPEPDEESIASTSIQIIPVASGYRDKKKNLTFTTEYDFHLSELTNHDCISIPRDKLLTVSGFSFDTYKRLQNNFNKGNRYNK